MAPMPDGAVVDAHRLPGIRQLVELAAEGQ
jgi:hypothetical protein